MKAKQKRQKNLDEGCVFVPMIIFLENWWQSCIVWQTNTVWLIRPMAHQMRPLRHFQFFASSYPERVLITYTWVSLFLFIDSFQFVTANIKLGNALLMNHVLGYSWLKLIFALLLTFPSSWKVNSFSCHWLCFPNGLTLHLFAVWRKDEQVNSYSSRDSLWSSCQLRVVWNNIWFLNLPAFRPAIKYATACDRNCVMHHDFYVFHLKLIYLCFMIFV